MPNNFVMPNLAFPSLLLILMPDIGLKAQISKFIPELGLSN